MMLDEVEVQVHVDGQGNVGIAGIAAAEVTLQGGIKLVLRRKKGMH